MATWRAGHDKSCTALRLVVDWNAYSDIEDMTNVSEAWKLLETNFKPRGSGFLNDSFQKLLNLILANCKGSADYVLQFRDIVTKLKNFSTKLKLDENFLIFLYQSNLDRKSQIGGPWVKKPPDVPEFWNATSATWVTRSLKEEGFSKNSKEV